MFIKPWQSIKKYKQVYKKYKNIWESIKSIKSVPPGRIWQWSPVAVHSQINPGGTDFILFILPRMFFILFYTFLYFFILCHGFLNILINNVGMPHAVLYFWFGMCGCLKCFILFDQNVRMSRKVLHFFAISLDVKIIVCFLYRQPQRNTGQDWFV